MEAVILGGSALCAGLFISDVAIRNRLIILLGVLLAITYMLPA